MSFTGKIPDDIERLLLIPYKKRFIVRDIECFREGFPNSCVLWDQSGTVDDALIRKNEIEVGKIASKKGSGNTYIAIPKFEECELSEEALDYVRSAVYFGLRSRITEAMKPTGSELYLSLTDDEIDEIMKAITFERCHARVDEHVDHVRFREEYFHCSIELVLRGYAKVGDNFVELARNANIFNDCLYIWTQTIRNMGIPIVFAPAYIPSDFDIKKSGIIALGEGLGIDSMVDAYFEGVPIEDILA